MPQKIRLWAVAGKKLEVVQGSQVRLEERLEDWLASDISILDPDLLVIGRQVKTDYGHSIDLLCIDEGGDLVVVELKQGQTPRDVAAQALEYASWVKDLTADRIKTIADEYLKTEGPLDAALVAKFDKQPETLNESHRSLIVAEDIGASTERIVRYLSELGVPINVATVQAFQDANGKEMLAQVFLVEPEVAHDRARASSRKTQYLTASEMEALADANGLGDLYRNARNVSKVLKAPRRLYREDTHYGWRFEDGRTSTVLSVSAAKPDNGGMRFEIDATRFRDYMKIPLDDLRAMLPNNAREESEVWSRCSPDDIWLLGAFHTVEEVDTFVAKLTEAVERTKQTEA